MIVFKDKYLEWLDAKIEKMQVDGNPIKQEAFIEAKKALKRIIKQEYKKILESKK